MPVGASSTCVLVEGCAHRRQGGSGGIVCPLKRKSSLHRGCAPSRNRRRCREMPNGLPDEAPKDPLSTPQPDPTRESPTLDCFIAPSVRQYTPQESPEVTYPPAVSSTQRGWGGVPTTQRVRVCVGVPCCNSCQNKTKKTKSRNG